MKRKGGQVVEKMDPFATYLEPRPGTGAVIRKKKTKKWKDGLWMGRRKRFGFQNVRLISMKLMHHLGN